MARSETRKTIQISWIRNKNF